MIGSEQAPRQSSCSHSCACNRRQPRGISGLLKYFRISHAINKEVKSGRTCAISSVVLIILARLLRSSSTFSTARLMPRRRSIGFMPAATDLQPSLKIARVSTVAVVVPDRQPMNNTLLNFDFKKSDHDCLKGRGLTARVSTAPSNGIRLCKGLIRNRLITP